MTNLQLLLSIGIPSLLVILSWMQTNARLVDLKAYIDVRFTQVDQRFSQVDQRFVQVDQRFAQIEQRIDRIDHRLDQMEARIAGLETDYREFYGMEKKLEGRVDELSRRA